MGSDIEAQANVVAEKLSEHFRGEGQGLPDVQRLLLEDLAAAKGEHLLDELGGAVNTLGDMVDGGEGFFVEVWIFHEQAGVALNDGHDIIELVGETGGQLTDGGEALLAQNELLAFLEGELGLLSFGDFLSEAFGPLIDQFENLLIALAQGAETPADGEAIEKSTGDRHGQETEPESGGSWKGQEKAKGSALAPEPQRRSRGGGGGEMSGEKQDPQRGCLDEETTSRLAET
jgi:hypothetical protein